MTYATAIVRFTPVMMAEAFWQLGSGQQVEFFTELAKVIRENHKTNSSAYNLGELQWFYVGDELMKQENNEARSMLMTMAAPLYLNTLKVSEA